MDKDIASRTNGLRMRQAEQIMACAENRMQAVEDGDAEQVKMWDDVRTCFILAGPVVEQRIMAEGRLERAC